MADLLFELVARIVVEGRVNGLAGLWRKPEVLPYIDLQEL